MEEQDGDCTVSHNTLCETMRFNYTLYLVCKGIIDLHGGSISASSEGVGKGACFTIELPIASHTANPLCESDSANTFNHISNSVTFCSSKCLFEHFSFFCYLSTSSMSFLLLSVLNCVMCVNLKARIETEPDTTEKLPCREMNSPRSNSFELSQRRFSKSSVEDHETQYRDSQLVSSYGDRSKQAEWKIEDRLGQFPRKRALIVDDVPMNRKMLRRLLESRFDVCTEAENGQQAVNLVREALVETRIVKYDLITMDYQMPVLDGGTAIRHIRQLGYQGVIVAVTGNALPEDIHLLLSSGANKVLTKPISIAMFDEIVDSLKL